MLVYGEKFWFLLVLLGVKFWWNRVRVRDCGWFLPMGIRVIVNSACLRSFRRKLKAKLKGIWVFSQFISQYIWRFQDWLVVDFGFMYHCTFSIWFAVDETVRNECELEFETYNTFYKTETITTYKVLRSAWVLMYHCMDIVLFP